MGSGDGGTGWPIAGALAIAVLILLASAPTSRGVVPTHHASLSSAFHPAPGLSASLQGTVQQPSSGSAYDEQTGTTFTQDLGGLSYNVTALAQTDADGYGPAYILNGLTTAGYWYQVGISYHWPNGDGGYNSGFAFVYQVYAPDGRSVFPSADSSGVANFSKVVNSGDTVLIGLTFSGSSIEMTAQDLQTGAEAGTSYDSMGSSTFVGDASSPDNSAGFFTGLMTEWYHSQAYTGDEGKVVYSNQNTTVASAWLWVDEFAVTSNGTPGSLLFDNQTQTPVTFPNAQQIYPFTADGITLYESAHEFISGLLDAASSSVMLTPATQGTTAPAFDATYTLAGLQQDSAVASGTTTMMEVDPGTSVTLMINSSASSASLERWVFNGTSDTTITFAAGQNVTYVYYELVQQLVSSAVVGSGAPLPSSPVLTYEVPASGTSSGSIDDTANQTLTGSPVAIYAVVGTRATVTGNVSGTVAGERWATTAQSWTVTAPNVLPDPIEYYQQYEVTVGYLVAGGGTPPESPEFTSTAFGTNSTVGTSSIPAASASQASGSSTPVYGTIAWFDSGSAGEFTYILNGTTSDERWAITSVAPPYSSQVLNETHQLAGATDILSPGALVTATYSHQFFVNLQVNDGQGGSLLPQASGWLDAGSALKENASANQGWQFESWTGAGAGAYNGTSASIDVTVNGPLSENATFYVQLAVTAAPGADVSYSYGSQAGTVQAGTSKAIYVPPSSDVVLRASPSSFVYSFDSWTGPGVARTEKPAVTLAVDSPTAITTTSSYDYPLLLSAAIIAVVFIVAVALFIRSRGRTADLYGPGAL